MHIANERYRALEYHLNVEHNVPCGLSNNRPCAQPSQAPLCQRRSPSDGPSIPLRYPRTVPHRMGCPLSTPQSQRVPEVPDGSAATALPQLRHRPRSMPQPCTHRHAARSEQTPHASDGASDDMPRCCTVVAGAGSRFNARVTRRAVRVRFPRQDFVSANSQRF